MTRTERLQAIRKMRFAEASAGRLAGRLAGREVGYDRKQRHGGWGCAGGRAAGL